MRGSTFFAVFLIILGMILLIAAFRGRVPQLVEALGFTAGTTAGTTNSRAMPTNQRAPRRSA